MARIALFAGWALGAALAAPAARFVPPDESLALARFLTRPDEPHLRLRALRHMRVEGLGERAFMDVRAALDPDRGLELRVEAEGGSGFLRDRALRGMLDQERQAHASRAVERTSLTADNYELSADGRDASGLVRLRAVPRRREAALLDGRFFVTPDTADLVRAEGRLARSPSFWLTRVDVVRQYRRIRGHRLQVRLDSRAQLRLFGEVRVTVDFEYEMVDGQELGSVDS